MENRDVKFCSYLTHDAKLAALLLAEIPRSFFEIQKQIASAKLPIDVFFPHDLLEKAKSLIQSYEYKQATVHLYEFNMQLNRVRDALRTTLSEMALKGHPHDRN